MFLAAFSSDFDCQVIIIKDIIIKDSSSTKLCAEILSKITLYTCMHVNASKIEGALCKVLISSFN